MKLTTLNFTLKYKNQYSCFYIGKLISYLCKKLYSNNGCRYKPTIIKCLLILLCSSIVSGAIAQAPTITPKPDIVLSLQFNGDKYVAIADMATVTTKGAGSAMVTVSPFYFGCENLGKQIVTVTAINRVVNPSLVSFNHPNGVVIDPGGNLYITEDGNRDVRRITVDGIVSTFSDNNMIGGGAYKFIHPGGISINKLGGFYIADYGNFIIQGVDGYGNVSLFNGVPGTSGAQKQEGYKIPLSIPAGTAVDGAGNIYVCDSGSDRILKISPDGYTVTLAGGAKRGFTDGKGTAAAFNQPSGIAVDGAGNVYVADTYNHSIRKITTDGNVSTLAGNGTAGITNGVAVAARFFKPVALTVDAAGNVYVVDNGNEQIRKITPGGETSLIAGTGSIGATDGNFLQASFNNPTGIAIDVTGNLFITDAGNNKIREVTTNGAVYTLAGSGQAGNANGTIFTTDNSPGNTAVVKIPVTVVKPFFFSFVKDQTVVTTGGCSAVLPDYTGNQQFINTCYVQNIKVTQIPAAGTPISDQGGTKVTLFADDGHGSTTQVSFTVTANTEPIITPVADKITIKLDAKGSYKLKATELATVAICDNVPLDVSLAPSNLSCADVGKKEVTVTVKKAETNPAAVSFTQVSSIMSDQLGDFVVCDAGAGVLKYISATGEVTTMAGNTNTPYSSPGGPNYGWAYPSYPVMDKNRNVYFVQGGDNIIKLTPSGNYSFLAAGNGGNSVDGVGDNATVSGITGMTIDDAGNLYITELYNKVRKITPDRTITTIAGSKQGYTPGFVDGRGNNALFYYPLGIVIDATDNFYVADKNNYAIRKITSDGIVTTLAGGSYGFKDGTGLEAKFSEINAITIDKQGNLYVSDVTNNAIRKITPAGVVTTLAGNGTAGFTNGKGTDATFYNPISLTCDANDNIYVTDYNDVIRKITPQGDVTTFAGSGNAANVNGNIKTGGLVKTLVVPINVESSLAITIGTGDMHLPVNTICPTVLPDYTKLATYADNCSNKVTFTQTPAAGTPVTGTDPFMVTIAATDDLGTTDSKSFKVIPDNKPLPAVTLTISTTVTTVCDGSTVEFTASSNYAGATPSYQWHVNGGDVGDSQPVFTTNTLKNSDVVSCTLMGSAGCQISIPSNAVTMSVSPNITPTVSIAATSNDICVGYNDIFTATAQNAGSAPSYKWLLNGGEVSGGANGASYQNNSLANGDKVSCVVTNNDNTCLTTRTATSAEITIVVSPMVTPAVSISSSAPSVVCIGTEITFTATPFNAAGAVYEWHVNGINVGSNGPVYKTNILADGDVVTCTIQVSGKCLVVNSVISSPLMVHISAAIKPVVTITPQTIDVCAGTPVTFIANVDNNLTGITYQWQINGVNTGSNSGQFALNSLNDGDVVMCTVTGNSGCVLPAQSLPVTVHINPLPTVTFNQNLVVKRGSGITLTPIITGNIKSYNWIPSVGLSNTAIANPVASPQATTTYNLQVITLGDCPVIVPVTVSVITPIDIPNTFTPNNDGVNDTWSIASLQYYNNCTVDVFNRYGVEVFHSAGYIKPWDGTFKGQGLPTGTYYYLIDLKNTMKKLAGAVTIIR
jgi:gliding motility-associated-like protein